MTPQELHAAIDACRQHGRRTPWWQVAVQADLSIGQLERLKKGGGSQTVLDRAAAWLERSRE